MQDENQGLLRGILYHRYEFDKEGRIIRSDCVIPTSQNHANIQHDLTALAEQYAKERKKDRDIELLAQMLVRSYDPCISCSVHLREKTINRCKK